MESNRAKTGRLPKTNATELDKVSVKTPKDQAVERAVQRTKSQRSGLVFPVGRVKSKLKKGNYADRISDTAAVYMTAVLEYVTSEVVELAKDACQDNKRSRINPRHIMLGIKKDDELNQLLGDVMISQGGVVPQIHSILLPKETKARSKRENNPERAEEVEEEDNEEYEGDDDDDDDDVDDGENAGPSQSY